MQSLFLAGDKLADALRQEPTCEANRELTDFLLQLDRGWGIEGSPDWMQEICPEVVDHFTKFPLFGNASATWQNLSIPIQSTIYAAQAVCTAKVATILAATDNIKLYLHAGSHLGAVIHGQPIPWDDDFDMFMEFRSIHKLKNLCRKFGKPTPLLRQPRRVDLRCRFAENAVKIWLQYEGMKKETLRGKHYSPFVDLFFYNITEGIIFEVSPMGEEKPTTTPTAFNITDYFPTRPYYFGGVYFIGPQAQVAFNRYDIQDCKTSRFNHRLEEYLSEYNQCLDCFRLHAMFPFSYESFIKVLDNDEKQATFPPSGSTINPIIKTSVADRYRWKLKRVTPDGQNVTDSIPNLNAVEIDNSISLNEDCNFSSLHVVEFNAERGRWWLESVELLQNADVIILNEMDIGMARSDQQHTTRLLAHFLKMNYAWGLEFIELTLGDKGDLSGLHGRETNFHGLHGNAILSKCTLSDPQIFRDPIGPYFSHRRNAFNARGLEKRLGGRMVMLCRIIVNGKSIAIGSIHKLEGYREEIRGYLNQSVASVIAGDQSAEICNELGLNTILSNENHFTWPASCETLGQHRGDNICSNLDTIGSEYVLKPCKSELGMDIFLSDHAVTGAYLKVAV